VIEVQPALDRAPIDPDRVRAWLERVPALLLDGHRPTRAALTERLKSFWWPASQVVYIGRTTGPLGKRLGEFERHILGNRGPHRGGHWIKTLSPEVQLMVSWSPCRAASLVEGHLLSAFREALRARFEGLAKHSDHELLPFANLETEHKVRKAHGLEGQALPRETKADRT
jgi:hypothetical protein